MVEVTTGLGLVSCRSVDFIIRNFSLYTLWQMALQPLHDVETLWAIELDGVTVEKIRHDCEVSIGGELIGDAARSLRNSLICRESLPTVAR